MKSRRPEARLEYELARNEAEKVISPSNVLNGVTEPPTQVTTQKASTEQTTDFFLEVDTTTEKANPFFAASM